jgi:hypothetical protein
MSMMTIRMSNARSPVNAEITLDYSSQHSAMRLGRLSTRTCARASYPQNAIIDHLPAHGNLERMRGATGTPCRVP